MSSEQILWTEIYRPKKIADCILPEHIKTMFQQCADKKEIPHMLLSGGPGCGKCLDPNEEIEIQVPDDLYNDLVKFISEKST